MATKQSKALEKFAELMIEKINQVSDDWKKPWIVKPGGQPQNAITGRPYHGLNDLMLFFNTEKYGYKVPAYLTFQQTNEVGSRIKKDEKAFPIAYWGKYYYEVDNPTNHIKPDEYRKLSESEKKNWKEKFFLQEYKVFNVEQTTIPQDKPELWEKIQQKFEMLKLKDENGMFKSAAMDEMLANHAWLCPINVKESNRAFYRPQPDDITVPLKAQFKDGESFYATMLHEMAHSTGHEDRLKRDMSGFFGNEKYAKEELVAELTAALSASSLGISTSIREENAQYLKSWLETLKEEPKFILTVLSDVHKASTMINGVVLKNEIAQKEDVGFIAAQTDGAAKINVPEAKDITPEDTKKILELQPGQHYLYGKGQNATEVEFISVTPGGVYTFKEVDSGFKINLASADAISMMPVPAIASHGIMYPKEEKPQNDINNGSKALFAKDELPKDQLKAIGVKMSDISTSDLKKLLAGKETKDLPMKHPETGEKAAGKLSLMRDQKTGAVSVSVKFSNQQGAKKGIKV